MKKLAQGFAAPLILLVIGLIVGAGVVFAYFQFNSKTSTPQQTSFSKESVSPAPNLTQYDQINKEPPENTLKIKGYYFSYEADDWGTPTTCNGFVVTDGDEKFISDTNKLIAEGNLLNKNIKGKLVVNVNIDGVENNIKTSIKKSSEKNQVELSIVKEDLGARGTSTCTSLLKIVAVN